MTVAVLSTCSILKHVGCSGFLRTAPYPSSLLCHVGKTEQKYLTKKGLSNTAWSTHCLPCSVSSLHVGTDVAPTYSILTMAGDERWPRAMRRALGARVGFLFSLEKGWLQNAVLSSIPRDMRRNNTLQKLLIYDLETCHRT